MRSRSYGRRFRNVVTEFDGLFTTHSVGALTGSMKIRNYFLETCRVNDGRMSPNLSIGTNEAIL